MKTIGIALFVLISTAAFAQQSTPPQPIQTPPGPVLQIVPEDSSASHLDVEIGAIRLTNHSGRYTFAYLPLLAPLPGTAFRPSIEMPNALALTGTTIPQKPRTRVRVSAGVR
ncbi:MAG: hypothetical protein ACRD3J_31875 [Thermoanaerobaculia bacterium]